MEEELVEIYPGLSLSLCIFCIFWFSLFRFIYYTFLHITLDYIHSTLYINSLVWFRIAFGYVFLWKTFNKCLLSDKPLTHNDVLVFCFIPNLIPPYISRYC